MHSTPGALVHMPRDPATIGFLEGCHQAAAKEDWTKRRLFMAVTPFFLDGGTDQAPHILLIQLST